jgi:hypothetical protein
LLRSACAGDLGRKPDRRKPNRHRADRGDPPAIATVARASVSKRGQHGRCDSHHDTQIQPIPRGGIGRQPDHAAAGREMIDDRIRAEELGPRHRPKRKDREELHADHKTRADDSGDDLSDEPGSPGADGGKEEDRDNR